MRIIRKRGIEKIKINHNKKLFWIIVLLMITLIILIYFMMQNNSDEENICIPATCCHPTECALAEQVLDCSKSICSMVCSGPLDCNAGHCEFINNKCGVVSDE